MKVSIYTDGACSDNPGPGGWCALFNREEETEVISGHRVKTTNNRMELMAVIKALGKILDDKCFKDRYELYSDSAYVVNAIKKHWVDSWALNGWVTARGGDIKNRDLWEKYLALRRMLNSRGVDISYIKVRGHSGNTFNEYVDKVAKEEVIKAKEKKANYKRRRGDKRA